MAGHNKWSKIKNSKGVADKKRGKLFTKLAKEIIVSARMGGGSLEHNARLRQAVLAAKSASMPKDNIDRAIKKGTGELQGEVIEEAVYEGYGPGGVAIMVETTSDNKNRTVSDLRTLFKSHGGALGESGSVAWMFSPSGVLNFEKPKYSLDTIMEIALEAGAEDVQEHEDNLEVRTQVGALYKVKEFFDKLGVHPIGITISYLPKNTVPMDNKETAERLMQFLEDIEDHDDVQRVHSNFEIEDRLMHQLTDPSLAHSQ